MDSSVDRIKCAMIIFELERSLGRLCKERKDLLDDSSIASEIKKRTSQGSILENSYLAEVLALALYVSRGTSSEIWLNNLNSILLALSAYEIRNAVSHPNRPFPSFYWYRCAAIATDPCIDALGMTEVATAFINAQEGRIQEPPEDWLHKMRWSVPAILPEEFEHSITGLVGRAKDTAKLEREIENSRLPLIAIVARGGVGKTSLLLQVVSDFCLSPKSTKYFDAAIWETLKQERLTKDGVEQLSAPASLEEVKISLSKSISELFGHQEAGWNNSIESVGDKRILLCLDNLEVLLRDNVKEFQSFHESLPASWKVIVTSRIPVDGAKNLPLDVLDKSGGIAMVRAYLSGRGYHEGRDSEFMERIAIGCKFNPLAIRLTVDLFIAGKEIDFALQRTEQEVLSFSFTSLLESLSTLDNNILEALFALNWSSRVDICNALKVAVDDVAESISKLLSMSLILRRENQGTEVYSLAPSIRDLLRAYPRRLAIRTRVANWIANSRATEEQALRIQVERNISPVALNYIPPDIIAAYISLCHQSDAAVKHGNRSGMLQYLSGCKSKLALDPDSSFLHRIHGNILLGLDDPHEAIASFQRAQSLSPEDPAPLFGLLTAYNDLHRWHDIESIGDQLIDNNWGEPDKCGAYFANRIWSWTLRSANLNEKVDEVFDRTSNWESRLNDLPALATSRSAAYRKLIEIESRQSRLEPDRLLSLLAKASAVLIKVALAQDFSRWICSEVGRLIADIKRYESRNIASSDLADRDTVAEFLRFCAKNGSRLVLEGISGSLVEYCRNISGVSHATDSKEGEISEKLQKEGFIITKVKRGTVSNRRFFFVQDESRKDYYVNLDIFEEGKIKNRKKLVPGAKVAIKVSKVRERNAPQASEAWLVA
jgi:tetratricopeptide (TPR) repeat protein